MTDFGEALAQYRELEVIMTDSPDDASGVRGDAQAALGLAPERGALMLALGIFSVVFPPLGILTWILAKRDLREMREGRMDPWGRSLTTAGLVLGIIGAVLCVPFILFLLTSCPQVSRPPPITVTPR